MQTAFKGLLALIAVGAIISTSVTPVSAQALAPGGTNEQTPQESPPPDAVQASQSVDLGTVETTAYSLRGFMASGDYTYSGAVAVDPQFIPLGSTLYIEGLGYFVAEDTGGAVRGDHIDIWLPSYADAVDYGVQYRRAWLVA